MCVIFSSFLVHFVPNIPDDHMITIWTMLRTVQYLNRYGAVGSLSYNRDPHEDCTCTRKVLSQGELKLFEMSGLG